MRFKIFKSAMDGVCGGEASYKLTEISEEIHEFAGWPSRTEMVKAIERWAKKAVPGDAFRTKFSVIVCCASASISDRLECPDCGRPDLDFGELTVHEDGDVRQKIGCACGRRWEDRFKLSSRRDLKRNSPVN